MPYIGPRAAQSSSRAVVLDGTVGWIWLFRLCVLVLLGLAAWTAGPVMLIAAPVLAVFGLLGDCAGAGRRVFRWIGLAAAVLLAPRLGPPLGGWIASRTTLTGSAATTVGVIAAGLGLIIAAHLLGRIVGVLSRRNRLVHILNHTLGNVFGLAEGAVVVAVVCWFISMFAPTASVCADTLAEQQPDVAAVLRQVEPLRAAIAADPIGRRVIDANPLPGVPAVATVVAATELAAQPGAFWQAVDAHRLDDVLAVPVVRKYYDAVEADPAMQTAIRDRDLRTILCSRHAVAAIADDELCRVVRELWPTLRTQIAPPHEPPSSAPADTVVQRSAAG